MPDRYVREAILRSAAWLSLTNDRTQLLFIRLILVADDFGVYDGRPEVIANNVYPTVCLNAQELEELGRMLDQLHRSGMIVRFRNRGKPYIAIWQWGNDLRGSRRFPAPPIDVDLEGINVRGKFGKAIGWQNPPGSDPVSVLLDFDGEPVTPQPSEWRPEAHLRPNPKAKVGWKGKRGNADTGSVNEELQAQAASYRLPVTGCTSQAASDRLQDTGLPDARRQTPDTRDKKEDSPPLPASNPHARAHEQPVPGNGKSSGNGDGRIEFEGDGFKGLSEPLQAHWQSMFTFPVPDQLERAGAWLRANKAEREAIERQGQGFESFLVRWLLREARTHGS